MQHLSQFFGSPQLYLTAAALATFFISLLASIGAAAAHRVADKEGTSHRRASFTGAFLSTGCSVGVLVAGATLAFYGLPGFGSFKAALVTLVFLLMAGVGGLASAVVGGLLAGIGAYIGAGTSRLMAGLLAGFMVFVGASFALLLYAS
jgi:hypothetical protein